MKKRFLTAFCSALMLTEALAGGAGIPSNPKVVHLDRPFIYMLIDCKNNLPVFIGTLEHVK